MRKIWITRPDWLLILGSLLALYLVLVFLAPRSPSAALIAPVLVIAGRSAAAIAAILANRRLRTSALRRSWALISVGLLLWTFAEAYGALAWVFSGLQPPIPSVMDWLRFAGYLATLAGLASFPIIHPDRFGRIRELLEIGIHAAGILGLTWLVLIRPIQIIGLAGLGTSLWLGGSPFFDLLLLTLLVRLILVSASEEQARVFRWMGLAFFVFALSDLARALAVVRGSWEAGGFTEAGWLAGSLILVFASRLQVGAERILPQRDQTGFIYRLGRRLEPLLSPAYAYLLVGFILLDWRISGTLDWVGLGTATILILLLIGRQGVISGQREMRKFAALVNASADMAFICDARGVTILTNPALRRGVGVPYDEEPSLRFEEFILSDPPAGEILSTALLEGWGGEALLRRKDGTTLPLLLSLRPIDDERSERALLAGTGHDLSEIKAHELEMRTALNEVAAARAELQELNTELEDKVQDRTLELRRTVEHLAQLNEDLKGLDRLKTEFVALVSHELRAPLTNIRSGLELILQTHPELSPAARDSMGLVQEETRRLGRFVESILDLSTLEAGGFPLELSAIPIQDVAKVALERFPKSSRQGAFRFDIPDDLPAVLADERALSSVLFHLLDNALKYAPDGEILIEARAEGEKLCLAVSDSGPGIPQEERERIFDMFHRLDSRDSRAVYGHGLGLHLTKQFIEAMGGSVRAVEARSGGAQIEIRLPLAPQVVPE